MPDGTDEDSSTETTSPPGGRAVAADGGRVTAAPDPEESRPPRAWPSVPADDDPATVAVRWADLRGLEQRVEELEAEVSRLETEVERARRRRRQTAERYERLAERHEGWDVTIPRPPEAGGDDDGTERKGSPGPVERLLSALAGTLGSS